MVPFLVGLVLVVAVVVVIIYNQLVALKNNRQQAFADVDVQLKLRYDLVPNLVNTVKGYASHEQTTFEEIARLRTAAMSAQNIDDKVQAENQFNGALKTLFAVAENYPELKANSSFLQLQEQLSDIENKIAAARRFFNNATKEYNVILMSFPANMLNGLFHFPSGTFFDLGSEAAITRENVTVKIWFRILKYWYKLKRWK